MSTTTRQCDVVTTDAQVIVNCTTNVSDADNPIDPGPPFDKDVTPTQNLAFSVGIDALRWLEAHIQTIYANNVRSAETEGGPTQVGTPTSPYDNGYFTTVQGLLFRRASAQADVGEVDAPFRDIYSDTTNANLVVTFAVRAEGLDALDFQDDSGASMMTVERNPSATGVFNVVATTGGVRLRTSSGTIEFASPVSFVQNVTTGTLTVVTLDANQATINALTASSLNATTAAISTFRTQPNFQAGLQGTSGTFSGALTAATVEATSTFVAPTANVTNLTVTGVADIERIVPFDGRILVDGDMVPATTNTRTLGTAALRWSHAYVHTVDAAGNITGQNVSAGGTVTTGGNITSGGLLTAVGATIQGALTATGTIEGQTLVADDIAANTAGVNTIVSQFITAPVGALNIVVDTDIVGAIDVAGNTNLRGSLTVQSNAFLDANLQVANAANLGSLNVRGGAIVQNTGTFGSINCNNDCTVNGDLRTENRTTTRELKCLGERKDNALYDTIYSAPYYDKIDQCIVQDTPGGSDFRMSTFNYDGNDFGYIGSGRSDNGVNISLIEHWWNATSRRATTYIRESLRCPDIEERNPSIVPESFTSVNAMLATRQLVIGRTTKGTRGVLAVEPTSLDAAHALLGTAPVSPVPFVPDEPTPLQPTWLAILALGACISLDNRVEALEAEPIEITGWVVAGSTATYTFPTPLDPQCMAQLTLQSAPTSASGGVRVQRCTPTAVVLESTGPPQAYDIGLEINCKGRTRYAYRGSLF